MVLLKNTNNALPLTDDTHTVGIFGAHAGSPLGGPNLKFSVAGSDDIYQGHITTPAALSYVVSPHYAFTTRAQQNGMMLSWIMNNTWADSSSSVVNLGFGVGITGPVMCRIMRRRWRWRLCF